MTAIEHAVHTERVSVTRSEVADLDSLCHGSVVRGGEQDACSKPATTILYDAEHAAVWPACSWHANRCGGALTLAQLREALEAGATQFEREVPTW